MKDYSPLNLSRFCNVGVKFLNLGEPTLIGKQTLQGLPFKIGGGPKASPKKCYIGFNGDKGLGAPVTIPIKSKAKHVIVAHTLLETRIPEGENVGRVIANYVFHYADGSKVSVPIRERLELAVLPAPWGQLALLAIPDHPDELMDRYEGHWDSSGQRLTEARQGMAWRHHLWPWTNPHPDRKIESMTIEPGDRKFVVAAVTLSKLDEYPFCTTARREVKITLPKERDAQKPFKLGVEVDRGVTTYAYPLPEQTPDQFLNDDLKGFGQTHTRNSKAAYAHIAASPSATVTVKHDGKTLGKVNWGELEEKKIVKTERVEMEITDSGKNWVHTTIIDEDTGKPTSCRVHFRSLSGVPYQPIGHHDHLLSDQGTWHIDVGGDMHLGQTTYAYIDGKCQGWLPRGKVIVDVARGFEYEPLRQVVDIKPGQRELTLGLQRWTDMAKNRWFSGDTHVHFLGERGAHREASGEDLNVVNLLASQWGHLYTNTEDFIGRPVTSDDGKTIVYTTQENRQHMLGHITLLGLKEQVAPWCSDGPAEAEIGGNLELTLSHWADACHAQGGTVVIPHLPNPNAEPAALIASGRADAVEMLVHMPYAHVEYYRYLNCGYKLPLVGGTDKMDSAVPVGLCRTYVYIPPDEEFNYDNWCKHMRLGRTFISSGPILKFTVNGVMAGDTVELTGEGTVEVEATAESIFPVHVLQIVCEGNVVASTEDANGAKTLKLKTSLKVGKNTWLAARCAGPKYSAKLHNDSWRRGIFAHTSPVYIAVGGKWHMFDLATAQYMLTLIDGSVQYIRRHARQDKNQSDITHHHTHKDHQEFLESPFKEAAAALHRRMHEMGIPH